MRKTIKNRYIFAVIIAIILLFEVHIIFREIMLRLSPKYAVGMTIKSERISGEKGSEHIFYQYWTDDKRYEGKTLYKEGVKIPNGKYYVIYSSYNPNYSFIKFNKPISDSLDWTSVEKMKVNQSDFDWINY